MHGLFAGAAAQAEMASFEPWREVSFGATMQAFSWSLYSTTTVAPNGSIGADGWRLRLGSGYGRYTYEIPRKFHYTCPRPSLICPAVPVKARVSFGDILAGYQRTVGAFTVKAFVGVAIDTQALAPWDYNHRAGGRDSGWKAGIETWTNLTSAIWLQADAHGTTAHGGRTLLARLGYRLTPALSVGFEEGKAANVAGHQFRSGLFARYEWSSGEAVVAGGVSGEHHDYPDRGRGSAWASASLMIRY